MKRKDVLPLSPIERIWTQQRINSRIKKIIIKRVALFFSFQVLKAKKKKKDKRKKKRG